MDRVRAISADLLPSTCTRYSLPRERFGCRPPRAGEDVVEALLAHKAHEVPLVRQLIRLRDVPAGEVRAAHVEHLALTDQLLHGLPDLLPRGRAVDVVHLVEVDVVGLKSAQAVLARLP